MASQKVKISLEKLNRTQTFHPFFEQLNKKTARKSRLNTDCYKWSKQTVR